MRLSKQYGRALLPIAAMAAVAVVVSFSTAFGQGDGYGDARVPVIVTQPRGATLVGDEPHRLFVEVDVGDTSGLLSHELSYTWYVCADEAKNNCRSLSYSFENSFVVYGSSIEKYYFVGVTYVTNSDSKNIEKTYVESDAAKVVGTDRADADVPIISSMWGENASTVVGKSLGHPLSVVAFTFDDGALSYQWFISPNRNDTAGWTPIEGATANTLLPDVSVAGTIYYRVAVTNTKADATGAKTASKMSYAVAVRVEAFNENSARFPDVSQIKTVSVDTAKGIAELSAEAKSTDGGTLSYQWYRTTSESNVGGEPIDGATDATLTLDAADATLNAYYYVEVTNKNANASGESIAVATSDARSLTPGGGWAAGTAVQTHDRLIPQTARAEAAVAPITASVSGFAAGPNPVDRSRGAVVFFHQGKRLKEVALSVYDASGAFVKKTALRDNAAGGQSRRAVARGI